MNLQCLPRSVGAQTQTPAAQPQQCSDFAARSDWQLKGSARNRLQAKQRRHDNRKVTALLLLRKLTLQHKIALAGAAVKHLHCSVFSVRRWFDLAVT